MSPASTCLLRPTIWMSRADLDRLRAADASAADASAADARAADVGERAQGDPQRIPQRILQCAVVGG